MWRLSAMESTTSTRVSVLCRESASDDEASERSETSCLTAKRSFHEVDSVVDYTRISGLFLQRG